MLYLRYFLCFRLKDLLPQTEVADQGATNSTLDTVRRVEPAAASAVHPHPASLARKRKRTAATLVPGSDSDTEWSTGRETIDEFPSSEDLSVTTVITRRSFSAATQSDARKSLLGLPSMLAHPPDEQTVSSLTQHSSILSSDLSDPATSSSDSVTVGSLQQTPLDLSFDSGGASESESTPVEEVGNGELTGRQPKAERVVLDLTQEYPRGRRGSESCEPEVPVKGELEAVDEGGGWSLSLDISRESEPTPTEAATTPEPLRTPCSKRRRLESGKSPGKPATPEPCGTHRSRRGRDERISRRLEWSSHGHQRTCEKDVDSSTPTSAIRPPQKTPRRLFPSSSSTPRGSHDSDVYLLACQSAEYIDLTRDNGELENDQGLLAKPPTAERTATPTQDHHMCHSTVHVDNPQSITSNTRTDSKLPASEVGGVELLSGAPWPAKEEIGVHDVIVLSDSQSSSTSSVSTSSSESALQLHVRQ